MLLQGSYNFTHVVREFFLCEYAFEMDFSETVIRVAHNKGMWVLWRLCKKTGTRNAFEITDLLTFTNIVFSPADGLIQGFITAKLGLKKNQNKSEQLDHRHQVVTRQDIAGVLAEFVYFWCGSDKALNAIDVKQPGRNARLDEHGNFQLMPAMADWKN